MAQNDNRNVLTISEATREYTIDRSRLDPLANWIKSRQTIEHYLDDQYINYNLNGSDPKLRFTPIPGFVDEQAVYTIEGEDEIVGFVKAVNPELQNQEGLRYMYHGELPPNSQEQSNFVNLYIYKNPAFKLNGQLQYKSFAADILDNIFVTTDHIFTVTKENDTFRFRQVTEDSVNTFRTTLTNIFQSLEPVLSPTLPRNAWERLLFLAFSGNLTVPGYRIGRQVNNLYTVIYGSIDQAIADQMQQTTLFLVKQILLRALVEAGLVTESQLFSTLSLMGGYQFNKEETKVTNRYVKNIENSNFLNRSPVNSATISSQYNFYDEQYERTVKEKSSSDTDLPNLYVRNFMGLSVNRGVPRELLPRQSARIENYSSLLRLSPSRDVIVDRFGESFYRRLYMSMISGDVDRFYNLYSQILASDINISENLKNKNARFLMGLKEARRPGGAFGEVGAPLSLDIKFFGEGNQSGNNIVKDYQDFILNNESFDPSIASLENLSNYDSADQPSRSNSYLYSTEYLYDNTTNTTTPQPVELKIYHIDQEEDSYIFDNLPENYTSTLLQRQPLRPDADQLASSKQFLLRNAIRRSRQSYANIIYNKFDTKTEVFGYEINKTRAGSTEMSQSIFLGNGSGPIVYNDSQVVYGAEYDYKLTEYRFVYNTPYNLFTLSLDMPLGIMMYYLGFGFPAGYEGAQEYFEDRLVDASFEIKSMISCGASVKLVRIPVYDADWNRINVFEKIPTTEFDENKEVLIELTRQRKGAGGLSYPRLSVMDFPPTAPTLQFFPRLNEDDMITMNINLESGRLGNIIPENGGFDQTLEIVRIGDNNEIIDMTHDNQRTRFDIPEGRMIFANKGESQIRNIILYRTPNLNLNVNSYNDLYKSFNPSAGNNVLVRKYTTRDSAATADNDLSFILSYDISDNISPNVDYYYTCIAQDIHGQISNPSVIYRIKLVSENGMVIPEIDTVTPLGTSHQMADKNLGRFVKIDASNIQTFPYVQNRDGETISARSLAAALGDSIEEDAYIVRFTSKDTGRKFDLKLKFVVKVDGRGINGET